MATLQDAVTAITAFRNLREPLSSSRSVARVDASKERLAHARSDERDGK